MKLSEKGINKILKDSVIQTPDGESYLILNDLSKTEFEPDDFQGMVELTVDEAKFLDRCCVFLSGFDKRYYVEGAKDFHRKLSKRIGQAGECK